jgi:hypothetical protein
LIAVTLAGQSVSRICPEIELVAAAFAIDEPATGAEAA